MATVMVFILGKRCGLTRPGGLDGQQCTHRASYAAALGCVHEHHQDLLACYCCTGRLLHGIPCPECPAQMVILTLEPLPGEPAGPPPDELIG